MKIASLIQRWVDAGLSREHIEIAIGALEEDYPRMRVASMVLAKTDSLADTIELIGLFEADDKAAAPIYTRPYERQPQDPNEPVWVYVMGVDHPDDNLVKVGISKHPNYRREVLEKERGINLYVAHTEGPFLRPGAAEIERRAHEILAPDRERGEWFLCGVERAMHVVRTCAEGAAR